MKRVPDGHSYRFDGSWWAWWRLPATPDRSRDKHLSRKWERGPLVVRVEREWATISGKPTGLLSATAVHYPARLTWRAPR